MVVVALEAGMKCIVALVAVVASLGAAPLEPKDYKKSMEQVTITVDADVRQRAAGDAQWKQVVDWIEKKENWTKMFKRIDEQAGVYRKDGLPIVVTLGSKDTSPTQAKAGVGKGRASIAVSVSAFVRFSKEHRADLLRVTTLFVTHELTHCLQQGPAGEPVSRAWPAWIIEGMACYTAEDDLQDEYFQVIKQFGIRDLDAIQNLEVYPRGRLFFKYLNAAYGEKKLKSFIETIYRQTECKKAVEAVTGKTWDAFKAEELQWSREYAKKFGL